MILIKHPRTNLSARNYVLDFVLGHALNIEFSSEYQDDPAWSFHVNQRCLFSMPSEGVFDPRCEMQLDNSDVTRAFEERVIVPADYQIQGLPNQVPLVRNNLVDSMIDAEGNLTFDFFDSIYFMLTDGLGVLSRKHDEHGRLLAEGLNEECLEVLARPLVDELVILFKRHLEAVGFFSNDKTELPRIRFGCDVDNPLLFELTDTRTLAGVATSFKRVAGAIKLTHSSKDRIKLISDFIRVIAGDYSSDPYFRSVEELATKCKSHNIPFTAFFTPAPVNRERDRAPAMTERVIQDLIKKVSALTGCIGIHPAYDTFSNKARLRDQVNLYNKVMGSLKISPSKIQARMHYLQWSFNSTPQLLAEAGVGFDEDFYFPDRTGFRFGTCKPFPVFNVKRRAQIDMWASPLIAMDRTLTSTNYMGLSRIQAKEEMRHLIYKCAGVQGTFNVLIHNCVATCREGKDMLSVVFNETAQNETA